MSDTRDLAGRVHSKANELGPLEKKMKYDGYGQVFCGAGLVTAGIYATLTNMYVGLPLVLAGAAMFYSGMRNDSEYLRLVSEKRADTALESREAGRGKQTH